MRCGAPPRSVFASAPVLAGENRGPAKASRKRTVAATAKGCARVERTLVLVKPDGVQRNLIGEIVSRLERKGLRLVAARFLQADRALAEAHYAPHRERPFFPELIAFLTSGPMLALVWEGPRAIEQVRTIMGATDPAKSPPGSIRGDLALTVGNNLIHGSDGPESAEREIGLFFRPEDLVTYRRAGDAWAQGRE